MFQTHLKCQNKHKSKKFDEPFVKATISAPNDYVGAIMELCQSKRGEFITMEYLDDIRVNVVYYLPLSEIVFDFFDRLKSNTKGYASLNYEDAGYRESSLVKVDILNSWGLRRCLKLYRP